MEWIESLILGVVQGITEFLPVSSDGHLVITQQLFGWLTGRPHSGEENLFFDIMLHVGTLAAILLYYRASILSGARGFLLGAKDVPPGFETRFGRAGRAAGDRRHAAPDPAEAFLHQMDQGDIREQSSGRHRLLDHGHRLATGEPEAARIGREERACRDNFPGRTADRRRPDVRPAAWCEPQRPDHRLGAGTWVLADLGRWFQPADRGPRDHRSSPIGTQRYAHRPRYPGADARSHRPDGGRDNRGGHRRLHGHYLADTRCSGRAAMVFFCILDRIGDRGPGCRLEVGRIARCPPITGSGLARREPPCGITCCERSWRARREGSGSCPRRWHAIR